MSIESLPKKEKHADIMPDWETALDRLESNETDKIDASDIINITMSDSSQEIEKYLTDNIDDLTESQRNFILQSLRVKASRSKKPNV